MYLNMLQFVQEKVAVGNLLAATFEVAHDQ